MTPLERVADTLLSRASRALTHDAVYAVCRSHGIDPGHATDIAERIEAAEVRGDLDTDNETLAERIADLVVRP